jgi:Prohead core protein serine protease
MAMGQTLLIEDSGLSFRVEPLSEEIKVEAQKTGLIHLKGVPATILDEKNGNGRTYSEKEIRKSIYKLQREGAFKNRKLHCSADDHPKESYVQPIRASHIVTKAYVEQKGDKKYLMNDWLVLNTSAGKNLKALIEAGASFGTSIRGLGQLNEESKHVENYDYLGTDAVGNPSAGTFASPGNFEVQTESLSQELASIVKEELETTTMLNTSFDLGKAISTFTEKYFKEGKLVDLASKDMTKDLMDIQAEAVDAGMRGQALFPLNELTNRILGTPAPVDPGMTKSYLSDRDNDALNKAIRELEATQNLATHYRTISETLQAEKEEADARIAAFEDVSATIYTELQEATAKLSATAPAGDIRNVTEKALRTVRRVQKEAREVIQSLETRLENAIRAGDQFAENAIVLRRIVDTLYRQFVEDANNNQKNYVSTKGTAQKVSEKINRQPAVQRIDESQDKKYGPVPSPSYSGNRANWY